MDFQEAIEQQFDEIKKLSGDFIQFGTNQETVETLQSIIQDYQEYLQVLLESEIIERARISFNLEDAKLELKNLEAQLAGQAVEEPPHLSRLQQLYELLNTTDSLTKQLKAYLAKLPDADSNQYKATHRDLKRLAEFEEPRKAELMAIQDVKPTEDRPSELLLEIRDAIYRAEQRLIVTSEAIVRRRLKYCLVEFSRLIEELKAQPNTKSIEREPADSLAEEVSALKAELLSLQEEIKIDLTLTDDPTTRARHGYYLEKVQKELERIETEEKRMMRGRK